MIDSYYVANIALAFCSVLLGSLFFDYSRLITPKNLILGFISGTILFGYLFLPISITGPVKIQYEQKSFEAMSTSLHYNLLGYFALLLGILAIRFKPDLFNLRRGNDKPVFTSTLVPNRLFPITMLYLVFSVAIIIFTFSRFGVIPILSDEPMAAKFFQYQASEFVRFRPFYFMAISTLPFTLFFILCLLFNSKPNNIIWWGSLFAALIATAVLAASMKRGPLLFPFVILAMVYAMMGRIGVVKLSMITLGAILIGTSMWYIKSGSFVMGSLLFSFSNNFVVEIREFGRILISLQNINFDFYDMFMGRSFLAGIFCFIPTVLNPLKQHFYISRATIVLLGSDPDAIGAPRIGYVGEAYLNYGVLGIIIFSFILGCLTEYVNRYYHHKWNLGMNQFLPMLYVLFFTGALISFYQSGTANNIYLLARLMLFLPIYYYAIVKRPVKITLLS